MCIFRQCLETKQACMLVHSLAIQSKSAKVSALWVQHALDYLSYCIANYSQKRCPKSLSLIPPYLTIHCTSQSIPIAKPKKSYPQSPLHKIFTFLLLRLFLLTIFLPPPISNQTRTPQSFCCSFFFLHLSKCQCCMCTSHYLCFSLLCSGRRLNVGDREVTARYIGG